MHCGLAVTVVAPQELDRLLQPPGLPRARTLADDTPYREAAEHA